MVSQKSKEEEWHATWHKNFDAYTLGRRRVEIKYKKLVDETLIKNTHPNGIVRPDEQSVHIVFGGRITKIRNIVDNLVYEMRNTIG